MQKIHFNPALLFSLTTLCAHCVCQLLYETIFESATPTEVMDSVVLKNYPVYANNLLQA